MCSETLIVLTVSISIGIFVALLLFLARRRLNAQNALLAELQTSLRHTNAQLSEKVQALNTLKTENLSLHQNTSKLETQLAHEKKVHIEKAQFINNAKEELGLKFKELANDIVSTKSKSIFEQNNTQLSQMLNPLREQLKDFATKVHDTYDKESRERLSLGIEIKKLKELNAQISGDTINLTNALKGDTKTQGCWGEVILERALELSGLKKDTEYKTQVSLKNKQGKLYQPDVIITLPGDRHIIIDAKVSLTAYEQYTAAVDASTQKQCVAQHVTSIKNHLKILSDKSYQQLEGINALDFILLFMPIESAFSLALKEEPSLYNQALQKNIVLVTPTTLLATLRTIENMWRVENQSKHALKIAELAGSLHDKFAGFYEDLQELGKRLEMSTKVYDRVINKFAQGKGNVINKIVKLKEMGAKTTKVLPKVQEQITVEEE